MKPWVEIMADKGWSKGKKHIEEQGNQSLENRIRRDRSFTWGQLERLKTIGIKNELNVGFGDGATGLGISWNHELRAD